MKFTCNQQDLVKRINIVSKAVSSRTTIPSLKGILMEIEDGYLKMTASDLDITIETKIAVNDAENGSIIVPAKLFSDVVRKLRNTDITITTEDSNMSISDGNSFNNVVGFPADDFPVINNDKMTESIVMDKDVFSKMIRNTSFATSIDQTKGVLTGVLLEIKDNHLRLVAIDGFRMAITTEDNISEKEQSLVISGKTMDEINKIISEITEDDKVEIEFDKKSALIKIENVEISIRLIAGEFIKYEDIIPKDSPITVRVDRNDLISAVERASIFTEGKNNLIRLSLKGNVLTIQSNSEEGGSLEDIIVYKDGDDLEIGFNARYIMDVLKAIPDETVMMNLNTPITPCTITPVDGEKYKYLILPVRINN